MRSIEHANLIDAEAAAYCAARGAFVVPTLATYNALKRHGRALGFPDASLAKLDDVREAGLKSLELLKAAGVKLGFGTDLLGEMHAHQLTEFAIRAEVLSPLEVVRSATAGNAELFDRAGLLGCVAEGALADLIVVEGNPLESLAMFSGQGEGIPVIMKAGVVQKNAL